MSAAGAWHRRIMRPIQYAAAAALAGLTLTACGGASTATPPASSSDDGVTVGGAITVTGPNTWAGEKNAGATCLGMGGMDDLAPGASVRIATDAGVTLALTSLGAGAVTSDLTCRLPFTATGVRLGDGQFFIVEVSHRGQVRVERADLLGGTVALTI